MVENTNEVNFNDNNIFVDSMANGTAEKVSDSDDFYDDEIVEQPISQFDFDNVEPVIPVNQEENLNNLEQNPELPQSDIEANISEPIQNSENLNFDNAEVNEPLNLNVKEEPDNTVENKDTASDSNSSEFIKPLDMNSLSNEEMDKMIAEDKEEMDDSYVLSNFDVLFDSLYNDVNGANNFISNLIEQKKTVNLSEANVNELNQKLEKEKDEFAKYVEAQKQGIESEKKQCNEYIKNQKNRLKNEEEQFNADMEAARAERTLAEETLKIERETFEEEKEQFAKVKETEEEKLNSERQKLQAEKEQFNKEKQIELTKIENAQKELQAQKEQFAKAKELEEKKLELESKNLSQSCARFKELVSQFNSGFQQLPEDK